MYYGRMFYLLLSLFAVILLVVGIFKILAGAIVVGVVLALIAIIIGCGGFSNYRDY